MAQREVKIPLATLDLGGFETVFFREKIDKITRGDTALKSSNTKDPNWLIEEENSIVDVLDVSQPVHEPQRWFFPPNQLGNFSWNSTKEVGKGLANVANTCFLNATVQALAHCTPFAQDCLNAKHASRCWRGQKKQLCGFCCFEHHVQKILCASKTKNEVLNWPTPLLQLMKKEIRMNHGHGNWYGSQNCAHEWLVQFFDFLIKYDLPGDVQQDFHHGRIPFYDLSTVYLYQLFSCLIEESKICCSCLKKTTRYELNTCLRVPLCQSQSVEKALKSVFEPEMLTGSNQPLCECCGIPRDKKACRAVQRPPNILILLLQRTQYHTLVSKPFHKYRSISKNCLHMDIPLTISLEPYMASTDMTPDKCQDHNVDNLKNISSSSSSSSINEYHLLASVNHSGTAGFGHYWAIVKGADGQFYKFDDELRSRVSYSTLPDQLASAYLLFYLRQQPVPVKTPTSNIISPPVDSSLSRFSLTLCSSFVPHLLKGMPKGQRDSYGKFHLNRMLSPEKDHRPSRKENPLRINQTACQPCKKTPRYSWISFRLRHPTFSRGLRHLQTSLFISKSITNKLRFHGPSQKSVAESHSVNVSNVDCGKQEEKNTIRDSHSSHSSTHSQIKSPCSSTTSQNSFNVVIVPSPVLQNSCGQTKRQHKSLNVEQRKAQCRDTSSQYSYQTNPVSLWEDSDSLGYPEESVHQIREKIQKSLLPKTTRRSRDDLAYDRGRLKKTKTRKKKQFFDFASALNLQAKKTKKNIVKNV